MNGALSRPIHTTLGFPSGSTIDRSASLVSHDLPALPALRRISTGVPRDLRPSSSSPPARANTSAARRTSQLQGGSTVRSALGESTSGEADNQPQDERMTGLHLPTTRRALRAKRLAATLRSQRLHRILLTSQEPRGQRARPGHLGGARGDAQRERVRQRHLRDRAAVAPEGKGFFARPGVSITFPFDEPRRKQRMTILQVDVPVIF